MGILVPLADPLGHPDVLPHDLEAMENGSEHTCSVKCMETLSSHGWMVRMLADSIISSVLLSCFDCVVSLRKKK